jgi:hypothetical protein
MSTRHMGFSWVTNLYDPFVPDDMFTSTTDATTERRLDLLEYIAKVAPEAWVQCIYSDARLMLEPLQSNTGHITLQHLAAYVHFYLRRQCGCPLRLSWPVAKGGRNGAMQFLLAHAPYIHTCCTKNSHANP